MRENETHSRFTLNPNTNSLSLPAQQYSSVTHQPLILKYCPIITQTINRQSLTWHRFAFIINIPAISHENSPGNEA